MVLGSIRYYSTLIRETMNTKADEDGVHEVMRINEDEEADGGTGGGGGKTVNEEGPWLIYCLRFVRYLHTVMIELDLPREALVLIVELLSDLRLCCLQVTFQIIINKVRVSMLYFKGNYTMSTYRLEVT